MLPATLITTRYRPYNIVNASLVFGVTPWISVAIDIERGFDSVPETSFVEEAFRRGMLDCTLQLIVAFLSGHAYRARVGNTLSPNRASNIGVP